MSWLTRKHQNRYLDGLVITVLVIFPIFVALTAINGILASAFLFLVGAGWALNRYDQRRRQKRLDAARAPRTSA